MKLKFNPEAKVTEWVNGPLRFKNEGDPIEADAKRARVLLRAMHEVAPQQFVNVFVLAEQGKVNKSDKAELASTYPNDFPHAELLTKAGLSFDAVKVLSKEDLVKLDGIGAKSADTILAAFKEQ